MPGVTVTTSDAAPDATGNPGTAGTGVPRRPWDVLLVGGASGVGKSSLVYPLARRYGVPVLEVDDIVCALKAVTTPEQQPELFYWDTHPEAFRQPPEAIMEQGLALSIALQPALEAVIGNHLETDMPVVIEGDFLLPALAARADFAGVPAGGRVRALYVVESDLDAIVGNYRAREPGTGEQRLRAEVSMAWCGWIRREAGRLGVPVLAARPWADGIARAEATLAAPAAAWVVDRAG
jgi:hypothetical protein